MVVIADKKGEGRPPAVITPPYLTPADMQYHEEISLLLWPWLWPTDLGIDDFDMKTEYVHFPGQGIGLTRGLHVHPQGREKIWGEIYRGKL